MNIGSDGFHYVWSPSSERLLTNDEHLLNALEKNINMHKGYTIVASFAFHRGLTDYSARKRLNKWGATEKNNC